jgi:hypothetical protein
MEAQEGIRGVIDFGLVRPARDRIGGDLAGQFADAGLLDELIASGSLRSPCAVAHRCCPTGSS